ncbi:MAG: FGGY-family carbohydrate kinase, partial [Devosia sp.]
RLDALEVATDRLRLMGGGARSALWCTIRADLTGRPADVLAESDASAIGAALLALVADHGARDVQTASSSLRLSFGEVTPDRGKKPGYDEAYRRYRDAFAAVEAYWRPRATGACASTRNG